MRSSLLPGTKEGTPTDYAGTVLYLELSSPRPAFSPGQANQAGKEGKLRGVTPCAGYRRLILGLCGATKSGSSPRRRRVPQGPRGTSSTRGPVPCTPGHQRLSGGATFIPARTLVSLTGAGECALFVLPLHALAEVREVSPLSNWSSIGSRPSSARSNVPSVWIPSHFPFPPTSEAGVPFSCAWPRVCFRCCGLRPGLGVPGRPPRGPRVSSALLTPLTASGFASGGVRSPHSKGAPHCAARSVSASPGAGRRSSSPLPLQAGARQLSSSAGGSPSVDTPTPLKRPRPERGPDLFVSLTVGSGSERPHLGSRSQPRRGGPDLVAILF
ncbi:hypothetical protein NDU88_000745 [Pleurodeles waltl]|uniref:Uncharacterized protein n=1 Tax=Pleurodeles waltl TaxID=8319 RepID=A0AAV7P505_PLEWA|nr:hypothetical protein NDU88_000745 [Pleurodeles waltl]